eukprot:Nk52_evm42s279 gene=Nk52_evmTU42s279
MSSPGDNVAGSPSAGGSGRRRSGSSVSSSTRHSRRHSHSVSQSVGHPGSMSGSTSSQALGQGTAYSKEAMKNLLSGSKTYVPRHGHGRRNSVAHQNQMGIGPSNNLLKAKEQRRRTVSVGGSSSMIGQGIAIPQIDGNFGEKSGTVPTRSGLSARSRVGGGSIGNRLLKSIPGESHPRGGTGWSQVGREIKRSTGRTKSLGGDKSSGLPSSLRVPKSKFVPLVGLNSLLAPRSVEVFETQMDDPDVHVEGRVTVYCTAKGYNKWRLNRYLKAKAEKDPYGRMVFPESYEDALYFMVPLDDTSHLKFWKMKSVDKYENNMEEEIIDESLFAFGDVFYFEYGVVVMWSLDETQESEVLAELTAFESEKLSYHLIESDEFVYNYSNSCQMVMKNDVISINRFTDHRLKLAISYALSQSCRLMVYENTLGNTISSFQKYPKSLSSTGYVKLSSNSISRKIGNLYVQASEVNLTSNILDTPDFFWDTEISNELQDIYTSVRAYMEISRRLKVLNKRLYVQMG